MIDTRLVRALAALLIVNSHLEDFYPARVLAVDGLLGDSLFFLLSGLGLALSDQRRQRGLGAWYGRRLARIYPSVFLVVLVFDAWLKGGWRHWSAGDYAVNLLWAQPYPFIGQILVYYLLYFVLLRLGGARLLAVVAAALCVPYAAFPLVGQPAESVHVLHWLFYFQAMLLGGCLGSRPDWIGRGGWWNALALVALLPAYAALRFAAASGRLGGWFFLPHLLVVPMDVLLLRACQSAALRTAIERTRPLGWLAGALAACTLEIYLAHYQFLTSHRIASLPFPLNITVLLAASLGLAWAVARGADGLRRTTGAIVGRAQKRAGPAAETLRPMPGMATERRSLLERSIGRD